MIAAERFIARYSDYDAWMSARSSGVSATEVRDASTPAGFAQVVERRRNPVTVIPNAYMDFGSEHEGWITLWLKREYGLMPNEWLIAAEDNPLYFATPDALSLDHTEIGEVKTWGTEPKSVPLAHRRQAQWQMRATGTQRCIYAGLLRREVNGVLVPAWAEPKVWVIDRDDELIAELEATAERILESDRERV